MLVLRFYAFELFFIPIAFGMLPIMGLAWIASIAIAYMVTKFHSKD